MIQQKTPHEEAFFTRNCKDAYGAEILRCKLGCASVGAIFVRLWQADVFSYFLSIS